MQEKIDAFKQYVIEASANEAFIHHTWFATWHLEIVARISEELMEKYPDADKDMVRLMVWLHDYGKILDFDNQYALTLTAGKAKLAEFGFPSDFIDSAISNIEMLDKHRELNLREAPIEVKIVSSADGCSHMVGPFYHLWWYENAGKPYEELMQDNLSKLDRDWKGKIVLPEAIRSFEPYRLMVRQQSGELPERFID